MHDLPADHDDNEAPARLPPARYNEASENFFNLDFEIVSQEDRKANLKRLAAKINKWHITRTDEGKPAPDGLVLVMPEGYGKSHLVLDLIERGFKVVFCAKSHGQLDEKELGFRDIHGLRTHRFESKRRHFRMQLEFLGLEANSFKFVEAQVANPYAQSEVNKAATIRALEDFFRQNDIQHEAADFFQEHYEQFQGDKGIQAVDADVFLITFAAMQALSTSQQIQWWKRLGLIERTAYICDDEDYGVSALPPTADTTSTSGKAIHYPFQKVAMIYDDPDRSDVDWLRTISDETVEQLRKSNVKRMTWRSKQENVAHWSKAYPMLAKSLAAAQAKRNGQIRATPKHKIFEFKGANYLERPANLSIGHGLRGKALSPKVIITTTEWLTGYYALQTLRRSGLRPSNHVELFHSSECIVTAMATTITRKRNHAILLPILEKLKQEFPDEAVTLIADGLSCDLNLSNNKGRNDLAEATTIIKLSWPHPNISATIGAHFSSVENPDHDLMIATLLADLCNQAIGRNQGFRFKGKQTIVLIDPKYYSKIMSNQLLRYKLTSWSSKLPSYNRKTSKRAAAAALNFSTDQTPLEQRLLELIANFESFGLSEDAQRLTEHLPERQKTHYREWLCKNSSSDAIAAKKARETEQRKKNAEKVRRHRERKRQSMGSASSDLSQSTTSVE